MPHTPKIFTQTSEQIQKQLSRGLQIANNAATQKIIESENYYNLFNGYKWLFLNPDYHGPDEQYLPGTTFEEIHALYLFDRELRNIFIRYILEIENNIKSVLSHNFSRKYGHDNYLKTSNFQITVQPDERKTPSQKIGEVSDLIANLQREISRQQDQNDISRFFNLKPHELNSILKVLSIFRNACAHDERLYNLKSMNRNMRPNNIATLPLHKSLNIAVNGGNNQMQGKNDLFAIVIIFKTMLSEDSFHQFYLALDEQMKKLEQNLHTITITTVENAMGFIPNWRNLAPVSS